MFYFFIHNFHFALIALDFNKITYFFPEKFLQVITQWINQPFVSHDITDTNCCFDLNKRTNSNPSIKFEFKFISISEILIL